MKNKLDLIAEASSSAPLKRQTKEEVVSTKILRQNQSFSITPEIADLVASFKKGELSKAIKTALVYANKKGVLNDFKE